MATIPYVTFVNVHQPRTPGRNYAATNVLRVAYRKSAMLAGLHDTDVTENELLQQGKALFEEM